MFQAIQFLQKKDYAVVPALWIYEDQCYWPNYISRKRSEQTAKKSEIPTKKWRLYEYKQLGVFGKRQLCVNKIIPKHFRSLFQTFTKTRINTLMIYRNNRSKVKLTSWTVNGTGRDLQNFKITSVAVRSVHWRKPDNKQSTFLFRIPHHHKQKINLILLSSSNNHQMQFSTLWGLTVHFLNFRWVDKSKKWLRSEFSAILLMVMRFYIQLHYFKIINPIFFSFELKGRRISKSCHFNTGTAQERLRQHPDPCFSQQPIESWIYCRHNSTGFG